jgi:NAD(P)-dependent dehydrogenase (short-subunit alcohol dehydrogenase family)
VNSAGIAVFSPVIGPPLQEVLAGYERAIRVNTYGTYLTTALAANQMSTQTEIDGERGVIINISSICAKYGDFVLSAYAASKGGISGMTLALARDFAAHKVRINAIAPGFFLTAMNEATPKDIADQLIAQTAALSAGDPAQFAHLAQAIVENKYISGSIVPIDGGYIPTNSMRLHTST